MALRLATMLGAGNGALTWEASIMQLPQPADAYLLYKPDAAVWTAMPACVPAVAIGGADPSIDDSPVGLLAVDADPERVNAALLAVMSGLNVRDPQRPWHLDDVEGVGLPDIEPLTAREIEVLELIAKGLTNRDIGGILGISAHTAKFHVAQVLAKVGAASRAEAVSMALRSGLIGL